MFFLEGRKPFPNKHLSQNDATQASYQQVYDVISTKRSVIKS